VAHTLLLADDSVTIQRVIELTFADEDVRVVAVSDGDEAIALLDKTPPDIVLADVGMPGRNGYEVARHVKETPRLRHIPVVLLTGAFEPIDQAQATAAGCDGVLAKPFEPQLVIGRVKELLSKPKTTPASTEARPAPAAAPVPAAVAAPAPAPLPAAAPAQKAPAVETPPAASRAAETGDYFDRLDKAFATLGKGPEPARPTQAPAVAPESVDWFASEPPPGMKPAPPLVMKPWEAPPPPSGYLTPAPAAVAAPPPAIVTTTPAAIAPPPVLPPLADAFAALLAAEQSAPTPSAAPAWPIVAAAPPPPVTISDDLVAEVTRRVLDELTDRTIREAVAEKVSAVAERLVREEIDRIKASIK
jgi:CheY-like chemotaxis protein